MLQLEYRNGIGAQYRIVASFDLDKRDPRPVSQEALRLEALIERYASRAEMGASLRLVKRTK